jgi:hypothetical protein
MKGKGFTLQLDNTSGIVKSIKLDNGKEFPFKQSFKYYESNEKNLISLVLTPSHSLTMRTLKTPLKT